MMFSKTLIVRLLVVAAVVVSLWTIWKRIDAIIDNYQKYYDIALLKKIWNEEAREFDKQFKELNQKFDEKFKEFGQGAILFKNNTDTDNKDTALSKNNTNTESETERKWEEYQKKSPFQAENKPVPAVADEYTKGYYHGLWNFFITSGFASLFAALILAGSGIFIIRWLWHKINEQTVERFFNKFF